MYSYISSASRDKHVFQNIAIENLIVYLPRQEFSFCFVFLLRQLDAGLDKNNFEELDMSSWFLQLRSLSALCILIGNLSSIFLDFVLSSLLPELHRNLEDDLQSKSISALSNSFRLPTLEPVENDDVFEL